MNQKVVTVMSKVKFSDVVKRANTKEDRFNTDRLYYVGGEHIESNEVLIEKRGLIEGSTIGPMFYYGFKAGQVLYVSRNPHLRKAGMVTFDGICSEKTFVLETIDEGILLQRYLPFILQSDDFWDYAESHKSGSVNFFVNWSTLANYEFELPSIEKQKELSDILWDITKTRDIYKKMINMTDELIEAKFYECFEGDKYEYQELGSISKKWFKGQPFKKEYMVEEGVNPCIHYGELFTKYGAVINDVVSFTNVEPVKCSKKGDILFPTSDVTPDGLTKCSTILCDDIILGGDIVVMRPDLEINSTYLSYAIRMQRDQLLQRVTGSLVRHISAKSLKTVKIPIPPREKQDEFEKFIEKTEVSKAEINQSLSRISELYKAIIVENIK